MLKVGFISLGCSKNQVDSEIMMGIISRAPGYLLANNLFEAEVIIINTCAFIQDAIEESINTIIQAGQYKKEGKCRVLLVSGCLSQRFKDEILAELPEVDAIMGTGNFDNIINTIDRALKGERVNEISSPVFNYRPELTRVLSSSYTAYVKIAEGCNNKCSYCIIPKLRGPLKSRSIEDIYLEVNKLVEEGIKEVILIAQDTAQYGLDIYGEIRLVQLLKKLLEIDNLRWLRLMYTYPEYIDQELIELIAKEEKLCNYLDIPIQHSSNKIRKLMNRKGKRRGIFTLIKNIRIMIPDIVIRTSLIVGFPGEADEDFNDLLDFVKEIKLDRLGVFKYSREVGTAADKLDGHLSEDIKNERYSRIMELQQKISLNKNRNLIGKTIEVIIEEIDDDYYLGRSKYDAPEIDNQVYIYTDKLNIGDIVKCRIIDAYEYDLIGEIINEFTK
jgi:ribosomal protein S12 methylthiotransferase